MIRRVLVLAICGSLAMAGPVAAAGFEDAVVAQLQAQGYGQIRLEHTLLGRVRIVAMLEGMRREIILNPRTGEVLRDVLVDDAGDVVPQIRRGTGETGSKTPTSGGDDDGSDDDGSDDGGSDGGGSDDDGGDDDGGGDDSGDDDGGDDDSGDDGGGSGGSGSDRGDDDGGDDHDDDDGGDDHGDDDGGDDDN